MSAQEIIHQAAQGRFVMHLDGTEAVLEYRLLPSPAAPEGVDFTRTWVPPAHRGKGLAEALVRRGLKWAREQNYRIEASCWYVAKFLRQDS